MLDFIVLDTNTPHVFFTIRRNCIVPNSCACTAIYLGGKCSPTALLGSARLFILGNAAYTFFYLDHFYDVDFYASLHDFLSFGYCEALKDGLAHTVKVFKEWC